MTPPCWYSDAANRPRFSNCPLECDGEPVAAEHVSGGKQHYYCDRHAYWRGRDSRQALIRRLV